MHEDTAVYRSYLLRLWQVRKDSAWVYRVSLQAASGSGYWIFEDLDQLVRFLNSETSVQHGEQKESES